MAGLKYPPSVPQPLEFHRLCFGPTQRFFAALPADKQPALRRALGNHGARHKQARDGKILAKVQYLEVVATRA